LPLLLSDLRGQSLRPHEIIVVNDDSEDETEAAALAFGVTVRTLRDKPGDWVGKSWACQQGALAATGDTLVFLDADVRLDFDGLNRIARRLSSARHDLRSALPYDVCGLRAMLARVQPRSDRRKRLRAVPAGQSRPLRPIIAVSRHRLLCRGRHESAKSAVVEDLALAAAFRRAKIPFRIFSSGMRACRFACTQAGFAPFGMVSRRTSPPARQKRRSGCFCS
jgi:4,4'-diaponeurosporenoate glycosyltransferase